MCWYSEQDLHSELPLSLCSGRFCSNSSLKKKQTTLFQTNNLHVSVTCLEAQCFISLSKSNQDGGCSAADFTGFWTSGVLECCLEKFSGQVCSCDAAHPLPFADSCSSLAWHLNTIGETGLKRVNVFVLFLFQKTNLPGVVTKNYTGSIGMVHIPKGDGIRSAVVPKPCVDVPL